jgi:Bacterial Ig-like domain (group 1)
MSNSRKLAAGLAVLGACAAGMVACESVPLTAAPGTSLSLIANPEFVIANGGVSAVTAVLVEPAGTFVPDGTEVFFFTNLGRVDSSGKSVNGVVRVNFVSDARSGRATVTAISGGPAPAPTASPAATRSSVTASAVGVTAATAAVGASAAAGENSATVEISIGSALPARVLVGADPQRITGSRRSTITATVFDEFGNPVQNVPVVFSLSGSLIEETLSSGGGQQFTDSSGQVRDTLSTRAPIGGVQKTVTVTATTANGVDGTVSVFVN